MRKSGELNGVYKTKAIKIEKYHFMKPDALNRKYDNFEKTCKFHD